MLASHKETRDGLTAALLTYLMWGFLPVYFKVVGSVSPIEVVTHRVIWAVPFGALIIFLRKQRPDVLRAVTSANMMAWLAASAVLIAVNWFIYIWAIQDARIFETSLGYYINPLTNMLVGVVMFGERLRRLQFIAVVLATIGVLVLTISGGQVPWVALALAASFTAYAYIRKKVVVGAMPGLFVETLLLFPFAMGWFAWMQWSGNAVFGHSGATLNVLLMLAGPLTALPLLGFAIAARRLPLTTIGFLQFLAPTLQFATGVYYGETLTTAHLVCFGCIWSAVLFFSIGSIRR